MSDSNIQLTRCLFADANKGIAPIVQDSGTAAINARIGLPGSIHFQSFSFTNSTGRWSWMRHKPCSNSTPYAGGILPVNLYNVPSVIDFGATLPARVKVERLGHSPRGFSTNYTISQQGLTARIRCKRADNTIITVPKTVG